jgi:hypothetical protein
MKLKRTHIWIILMIVIFIVAVVAPLSIESTKEGYKCANTSITWTISPLPNGIPRNQWDVSNINVALNSVSPNFGQINTNDEAEVSNVINYFVDKGVKISNYVVDGKTTPGTEYPANGDGKCMRDNPTRTVYFKDRRMHSQRFGNATYDSCKAEADKTGATVFALQYYGECFVGDTNDIALGKTSNVDGWTAPKSDECGGRYGRGQGWTQNVYTKTIGTQLPSTTYYYLDKADMINIVNSLVSNQTYTNIHAAICASRIDNTIQPT